MSKLLKVAVIGVDRLGKCHADQHTDYREVIPPVDAISQEVPNNRQYKIARVFLEAGIRCNGENLPCETVEAAVPGSR